MANQPHPRRRARRVARLAAKRHLDRDREHASRSRSASRAQRGARRVRRDRLRRRAGIGRARVPLPSRAPARRAVRATRERSRIASWSSDCSWSGPARSSWARPARRRRRRRQLRRRAPCWPRSHSSCSADCRRASSSSHAASAATRCSPTVGCRASARCRPASRCSAPAAALVRLGLGRRGRGERSSVWSRSRWRSRPCEPRRRLTAALRRSRRVVGPGHRRRVGPQALEAVELARLGEEHVHDEIAVVEQDPRRVAQTFDGARLLARLLVELRARPRRRWRAPAGCSDALVITKHSTMPMISATSRTRMSSPFLSSAARAAMRDLVAGVGSGHTLPCCGVIGTSLSHGSAARPGARGMEPSSAASVVGVSQLRWVPSIAAATPATAARTSTPDLHAPVPAPMLRPRAAATAGSRSTRRDRRSRPDHALLVQVVGTEDPRRRRRHEEVDRLARRDAAPQVGRRQLERGTATRADPPTRRGRERRRLAVDDRERHELAQLVDAVPRSRGRPRRRCRCTRNSSRPGAASCSTVSIVYVGPSRSSSIRDASRPVDAVERGHEHLVPDLGGRDHPIALLPRVAGDHDEHAVEAELVAGRGGVHQMADVHRDRRCRRGSRSARGARRGSPARVYGERCVKRALRVRDAPVGPRPARRSLPRMTTTRDSPASGDGVRLVVRVWLPDRPGALGLVASRIGAIGADIVGVDVLERSEHVAVDEFAVVIAEHGSGQAARARDRRGRRRVGRAVGTRRALPRRAPRRARNGRARLRRRRRRRLVVPARRARARRVRQPTGRSCSARRSWWRTAGDERARRVGAGRARDRHRRVARGRRRRLRPRGSRGRAARPRTARCCSSGATAIRSAGASAISCSRSRASPTAAAVILRLGLRRRAAPAARALLVALAFAAARPGRARRRARGSARPAPRRARRARPRPAPRSPAPGRARSRGSGTAARAPRCRRTRAGSPSSATHNVTARRPGVSTSTPPSGQQHELRAVVVCRPRWSLARTSPVACTSAPTRRVHERRLPDAGRADQRDRAARAPRSARSSSMPDAGDRARDDHRRARRPMRSTARRRSIGSRRRDRPSSARSPARRRSRTRARARARAGAGSGRSRTTA